MKEQDQRFWIAVIKFSSMVRLPVKTIVHEIYHISKETLKWKSAISPTVLSCPACSVPVSLWEFTSATTSEFNLMNIFGRQHFCSQGHPTMQSWSIYGMKTLQKSCWESAANRNNILVKKKTLNQYSDNYLHVTTRLSLAPKHFSCFSYNFSRSPREHPYSGMIQLRHARTSLTAGTTSRIISISQWLIWI